MGGAITGAPKQIISSPPPPPTSSPIVPVISPDPPQHDSEWYLLCLFSMFMQVHVHVQYMSIKSDSYYLSSTLSSSRAEQLGFFRHHSY